MRFDRLIATAIMAIVICPATMADTVKTTDTKGTETICRSFVQSFYKWYLTKPQSDRAYKDKATCSSSSMTI